jgi:hypothetical protein
MYDRDLVLEILTQIYQATATISKRFEPILKIKARTLCQFYNF